MYRVVGDSARRFPTIFAKMRPIDQKKARVLSGTKTMLGEMGSISDKSFTDCGDELYVITSFQQVS